MGEGLEGKVNPFESQVRRLVQPRFDLDGVFGSDPEGLFGQYLEETVLKAEREVVGDDAWGPEGEDFVEVVCFQKGPVCVVGRGGFDGATTVMIGDVDVAEEGVSFFYG